MHLCVIFFQQTGKTAVKSYPLYPHGCSTRHRIDESLCFENSRVTNNFAVNNSVQKVWIKLRPTYQQALLPTTTFFNI